MKVRSKCNLTYGKKHQPYGTEFEMRKEDAEGKEGAVARGIVEPVEVQPKSKGAKSEGGSGTTELPEDFPGRAELVKADIVTVEAVRSVEDLTAVQGIGDATAAAIRAALEDATTD